MGKDPKNDAEFQRLAKEYGRALAEDDTPEGQTMSDRARAARDQMNARMHELQQGNGD